MHVLLLGVYGSGKSTVGKLLATDIHATFIEMDTLIHESAGIADPEAISPVYWKECQIDICKDLSVQEDLVIATSGNIVENDINLLHFRANDPETIAVYMHTELDSLVSRTVKERSGGGEEVRRSLEELLAAREPLYLRFADVVIRTDGKTPREIATEILSYIKKSSYSLEHV